MMCIFEFIFQYLTSYTFYIYILYFYFSKSKFGFEKWTFLKMSKNENLKDFSKNQL